MSLALTVAPHPHLDAAAFVTHLPASLGSLPSPPWLTDHLDPEAETPVTRSDALRTAVRDMLRYSGYKPAGRGKPAAEYLVQAAERGHLSSINPAVDACNVVSLHSGLPISVIDLDRASGPFHIAIADADARYVFNTSGQAITLDGLLCLYDAEGPCANAVKDSERTKTHAGTQRTLSVIWGVRAHAEQTARATAWYRELLERLGADTHLVMIP